MRDILGEVLAERNTARRIAIHEAGHAVVAALYDAMITDIRATCLGGHVTIEYTSVHPNGFITICGAGLAATNLVLEEQYRDKGRNGECANDVAMAFETLRDPFYCGSSSLSASISYDWNYANTLAHLYRDEILIVADALLKEGRMSASQLIELLMKNQQEPCGDQVKLGRLGFARPDNYLPPRIPACLPRIPNTRPRRSTPSLVSH